MCIYIYIYIYIYYFFQSTTFFGCNINIETTQIFKKEKG